LKTPHGLKGFVPEIKSHHLGVSFLKSYKAGFVPDGICVRTGFKQVFRQLDPGKMAPLRVETIPAPLERGPGTKKPLGSCGLEGLLIWGEHETTQKLISSNPYPGNGKRFG